MAEVSLPFLLIVWAMPVGRKTTGCQVFKNLKLHKLFPLQKF